MVLRKMRIFYICLFLGVCGEHLSVHLWTTNAKSTGLAEISVPMSAELASHSMVNITFPPQFPVDLGTSGCHGLLSSPGNVERDVECSVAGRSVSLSVPALPMTLSIPDVVNPPFPCVTDSFWLEAVTAEGDHLKLNLGTVEITPAPVQLATIAMSPSSEFARLNTEQVLRFEGPLKEAVEAGSWALVTFPAGFLPVGLGCKVSDASKECGVVRRSPLLVRVSDINAPNLHLRLEIYGVKTPARDGQIGHFSVAIYAPNSYHQTQVSGALEGLYTAKVLAAVAVTWLQPAPKDNSLAYTISFRPGVIVAESAIVVVKFPSEITVEGPCEFEAEHFSSWDKQPHSLTLHVASKKLNSTDTYAATVRASKPLVPVSSAFQVFVNASDSTLIAYSLDAARFRYTPGTASAGLYRGETEVRAGELGSLQLTLLCEEKDLRLPPTVQEGRHYSSGTIVVTLPRYAEALSDSGEVTLSCVFEGENAEAESCAWDNTKKQITVRTPSIVPDSAPLSLSIAVVSGPGQSGFKFPSTLTNTHIVRVQAWAQKLYSSERLVSDAFLRLTLPGGQLPTLEVNSLTRTAGEEDVVTVQLASSVELQEGFNVEVEVDNSEKGLETPRGVDCFAADGKGFTECSVENRGSAIVLQVRGSKQPLFPNESLSLTFLGLAYNQRVTQSRAFTVRTIAEELGQRVIVETDSRHLDSVLIPNISEILVQITPSRLSLKTQPEQLVIHLPGADIGVRDIVEIRLPEALQWPDASVTSPSPSIPVVPCDSDSATQYISASRRVLLVPVSLSIAEGKKLCVQVVAKYQSAFSARLHVRVISATDHTVKAHGSTDIYGEEIQISVVEVVAISAHPFPFNNYIVRVGESSLFRIDLVTNATLEGTGSIVLLLRETDFESNAMCYSLSGNFDEHADCTYNSTAVLSVDGQRYYQLAISGWHSPLAAGTQVVTVNATLKAERAVLAAYCSPGPIARRAETSLTASSASRSTIKFTQLQSATSQAKAGEHADLRFNFSLLSDREVSASTGRTTCGYVDITVPQRGLRSRVDQSSTVSGSFTMEEGCHVYCLINDLPAALCEWRDNSIRVYTPSTLGLRKDEEYSVVISAEDALERRGLRLPPESGHYQFDISVYQCEAPASVGAASQWVYIPALHSFSRASARLLSIGAAEPSALFLSLTPTRTVPADLGFLSVFFPLADELGNGWGKDLGLPAPSALACSSPYAAVTCTLKPGGNGEPAEVRIVVGREVPASTVLNVTIVGILTPRAKWYSVSLRVAACVWGSEALSMDYSVQEEATLDFVATIAEGNTADAVRQEMGMSGQEYRASVDLTLATSNLQAVSWALVSISTSFPIDSSTSVDTGVDSISTVFPRSGYILVEFPHPQDSIATVTVRNVRTPMYSETLEAVLYLYSRGKRSHTFVYQRTLPVPSCHIHDPSALQQGDTYTYCFSLQPRYGVPTTGAVLVSLPAEFRPRIVPGTCVVGSRSSPECSQTNVKCVQSEAGVLVTHLPAPVPPNGTIEVCIDIANPPPGAHTGLRFDTYLDAEQTQHSEECSYSPPLQTVAWTAPSPRVTASFMSRLVGDYVRQGDIEPLKLAFTSTPLPAGQYCLKVEVSPPVQVTQQELRCTWANLTASEVCDAHCAVTLLDTATLFRSTLPIDVSTGMVTITTGGSSQSGLKWSQCGVYTIDITAENLQESSETFHSRLYLTVEKHNLKAFTVTVDHTEAGETNTFHITFTPSVAVPNWVAGGRVLVEFPAFADDLGVGHAELPCTSAELEASIVCYVQAGDLRVSPAVVVTGFPQGVPPDRSVSISLFGIKNPETVGTAVKVTVKTVDVSAGWPGAVLEQGRSQQLYETTSVSPLDTGTVSVTMVNRKVWEETVYTLTFRAVGGFQFLSADCLYVTLDSRIVVESASVTAPPYSTFQYFLGVLRITLSADASSPFALSLSGVRNPASVLATGLSVTAALVRGKRIYPFAAERSDKDIVTPALANIVVASFAGTMYEGDVLDWSFQITLSAPIPAGGAITLSLSSSAFVDETCVNYEEGGSELKGAYTCTAGSQSAAVALQSLQPAGTLIRLLARVRNVGPSDHVVVSTLLKAADPSTRIEVSEAVEVPISTALAPLYHEVPVQVHAAKLVRGCGSFQFVVTLPVELPAAGRLQVDFPGLRGLAPGGQLLCLWQADDTEPVPLDACTVDGVDSENQATGEAVAFTIKAAMPAGRTTVTLTTRNARDPEGQGLLYPPQATDMLVAITVCYSASADCQTLTDALVVAPESRFQQLEIEYGHRHKAEANWFQVALTPSSAVSNLGMVVLQFPTNDGRNRLFLPDLGLGIANQQYIECSEHIELRCKVAWTDDHEDRPTEIRMSSTVGFEAGRPYTFTFLGIKNPPLGSVHLTAYSTESGQYLDFQTVPHLFTVLDEPPPPLQTSTSAVLIENGDIKISYPGDFAVTETSLVVVSLTFPISHSDSVSTDSGVKVWTDTKQISLYGKSSRVDLKCTSLPYLPIGDYVTLEHISEGRIVSRVQLPPIAGTVSDDGSSPQLTSQHSNNSEIDAGAAETVMVTYKVSSVIPADGCVRFTLSSSSLQVDPLSCQTLLPGAAVRCSIQGNTVVLNGFSRELGVSDTLTVMIALQAQGSIATKVETFASAQCSIRPITASSCTACLSAVASKSIEAVMLPPELVKASATAGDRAELAFAFRPQTLVPAAPHGVLRVYSTQDVMDEWNLQLATGEEISCRLQDSQSDIPAPCFLIDSYVEIRPGGDLKVGELYYITLTTRGMDGQVGLQLPTLSGRKALTLQALVNGVVADTGILHFELPLEKITKLSVTPAHYTIGEINVWTVELEVSVALVESDLIVVEFPLQTMDRKHKLFAENLGSFLLKEGRLPCYSTAAVQCELHLGVAATNSPAQVVITGLSGTTHKVYIAGIINPYFSEPEPSSVFVYMRVFVAHSDGSVFADRTLVDMFTFVTRKVINDHSISCDSRHTTNPAPSDLVTMNSLFSPGIQLTGMMLLSANITSAKFEEPVTAFSGFHFVYSTHQINSYYITASSNLNFLIVYYIGYQTSEVDKRSKLLFSDVCILGPLETKSLFGAISLPKSLCDYWQFCGLTIEHDFELPEGSYLALDLMGVGSFAAVDPNYFEAVQLPFYPQYRWDAAKGWFVMKLQKPVIAAMGFRVFAKVKGGTTFKASVYEDAALTTLIAATSSVNPVTCTSDGSADTTTTLTLTPDLAVGSGFTNMVLKFIVSASAFNIANSETIIEVDFAQPGIDCSTIVADSSATDLQISMESGLMRAKTSTTLETGKIWALDVTRANPICIATAPGYYSVVTKFTKLGTLLHHSVAKMYSGPSTSFLAFTLSSFANCTSPYKVEFSPSAPMPGGSTLVLEFPSAYFSGNLGLLSAPGTPAQQNDAVPVSGTSLEQCYLVTYQSSQFLGAQLPVRIVCRVQAAGIESGSSVTVNFPMLVNPKQPDSITFRLKNFQSNNEIIQYGKFSSTKPPDSQVCGLDSYASETNFLSVSSTLSGAVSTFKFSVPVNAGDTIMIAFGTEIGEIVSAQSSDEMTLVPGPYPCPCLLIVAVADRAEFSVSSLKLPAYVGQFHSVQVYQFRSGTCLQGKTFGYDISANTLQLSITTDALDLPMYTGSEAPITISLITPVNIPENSELRIATAGLQSLDISRAYLLPPLLTTKPLAINESFAIVTALKPVGAGTIVSLWNLFAAKNCEATVSIAVELIYRGKVFASGSLSATCDGSANYLPKSSFFLHTNALWTQARSDPDSSSDFVQVKLFLNLPSVLETSNSLHLTFTSGYTGAVRAYFQQGAERIDAFATSLIDPVSYQIYPLAALGAAGWTLCVSAFDGETYGLRYAPGAGFLLTATIGGDLYQAHAVIPSGRAPQSLRVDPFTYSDAAALPFAVTFTPSISVSHSNNEEIVVQLPGVSSNPTENTDTGQSCEVSLSPSPSSPAHCRFMFGDSSTEVRKRRSPPSFIISGVDVQAGNTVILLLPPIKRSAGSVSDVVVYTRKWDLSSEAKRVRILDYGTVRNAILTVQQTEPASNGIMTLTSYEVRKTGVTYTFPIGAQAARLILHAPPLYSAGAFTEVPSTTTLTLGPYVYCTLPALDSAHNLQVTNVNNINYLPQTLEESTITIHYATATYQLAVVKFTVGSLELWQASSLYTDISPAFAYRNFQDYYTFTAHLTDLYFPIGSVLVVQFPEDFSSFHWFLKSAEAECSSEDSSWACHFSSDSQHSITVAGRATGAAIAGSGAVHSTLFTGPTRLGTIAAGTSTIQFVDGAAPIQVPYGCFVPLQWEYHRYPVKANQVGELAFIFTPRATITHASIVISDVASVFPMTEDSRHLRCLFEDVETHSQYTAASCSATDHRWIVSSPLSTDLTSTKKWKLSISTSGLEPINQGIAGIKFPNTTQYHLKVDFPSGEVFEEAVANIMSAPKEATLRIVSSAKSQSNTQYILSFVSPDVSGSSTKLSLVFPTSLFGATASTRPMGADLGCSSTFPLAQAAFICTIQSASPTYSAARAVQLVLHGAETVKQSESRRVVFGGITNPSVNSWVGVRATRTEQDSVIVESMAIFPFAVIVTAPAALDPFVPQETEYFAGTIAHSITVPFSASQGISVIVATFPFKLSENADCDGKFAILDSETMICEGEIIGNEFTFSSLEGTLRPPNADIVVKVYKEGQMTLVTNLTLRISANPASMSISSGKMHTWSLVRVDLSVPAVEGGQSLTLTFPSSTALGPCQCEIWSGVRLGENLCLAEGSVVTVQMEHPKTQLTVRLWAKIEVSPLEVAVKVFDSAGLFGEGTGSLTMKSTPPFQVISHSHAVLKPGHLAKLADGELLRPMLSSGSLVQREAIPVSLQFTLSALAALEVTAEPQLIPADTVFICTWLSPEGEILHSSCSFRNINNSSIIAIEPPISASDGTWSARVTGQSDGFVPNSGFRYQLTASQWPNGTSLWLPCSSTEVGVSVFGTAVSIPNILELSFLNFDGKLPQGIGSGDDGEIMVLFSGLDESHNFGTTESGQIGCALLHSPEKMITCTLHDEVLRVRNFTSSLYSSNSRLLIWPFFNPSTVGKYVHLEVKIQHFSGDIALSKLFRYLFATSSEPVTRDGSVDWCSEQWPDSPCWAHFNIPEYHEVTGAALFIVDKSEIFGSETLCEDCIQFGNTLLFNSLNLNASLHTPPYQMNLNWQGWVYNDGNCVAVYKIPTQSFSARETVTLTASHTKLHNGAEFIIGLGFNNYTTPAHFIQLHLPVLGTNQEVIRCTVDSYPLIHYGDCKSQQGMLVLRETEKNSYKFIRLIVNVIVIFSAPLEESSGIYAEVMSGSTQLIAHSSTVQVGWSPVSLPTLSLSRPPWRSPEQRACAGDSFLQFNLIPSLSCTHLELLPFLAADSNYSFCTILSESEALPCFSYWDSHSLKIDIGLPLTIGTNYTVSIGTLNHPSIPIDFSVTENWWRVRISNALSTEDIEVPTPLCSPARIGQFGAQLNLGIEGAGSYLDVKVRAELRDIRVQVQKALTLLLQSSALSAGDIRCQGLLGTALPRCSASHTQGFQVQLSLDEGFQAGKEYNFRVFGVVSTPARFNSISGELTAQPVTASFHQASNEEVRFLNTSLEVEAAGGHLLIPRVESEAATLFVEGCGASEADVSLSFTVTGLTLNSTADLSVVLEMLDFTLAEAGECLMPAHCVASTVPFKHWVVVTTPPQSATEFSFSISGVKMPRDSRDSGYEIKATMTTMDGVGFKGAASCPSVGERQVRVKRSAASDSLWSPLLQWSRSLEPPPGSYDYWTISFPADSLLTAQVIKVNLTSCVVYISPNYFLQGAQAEVAIATPLVTLNVTSAAPLIQLKVAILLANNSCSQQIIVKYYQATAAEVMIASGVSETIRTGEAPFPYRAAVRLVGASYVERETSAAGELLVRVKLGRTVRAASSVLVKLPPAAEANTPNPSCYVTARELQVFESGWIKAACKWINKQLSVTLPEQQKPVWEDVLAGSCFWLRVNGSFHLPQANSNYSVTVETTSETLPAILSIPEERSDRIQLLVEANDLMIGRANRVKVFARQRLPVGVDITLTTSSAAVIVVNSTLTHSDLSSFFIVKVPCRFENSTLTLNFTVSNSTQYLINAVTLRVKKPPPPGRDGRIIAWNLSITPANRLKMCPVTDLPGLISWTLSAGYAAPSPFDDWVAAQRLRYIAHLQSSLSNTLEVFGYDDCAEIELQLWGETTYRITGSLDNCFANFDPPVASDFITTREVPAGTTIRVFKPQLIAANEVKDIRRDVAKVLGEPESRLQVERRLGATSIDITLLPSMLLGDPSPKQIIDSKNFSLEHQVIDRSRTCPQWLQFPTISDFSYDYLEVTARSTLRGQVCCVATAPLPTLRDPARQALLGLDPSMQPAPQQCASTSLRAPVILRIGNLIPNTTYSVLCGASDDFGLPTQPLLSSHGLMAKTKAVVTQCPASNIPGAIKPLKLMLSPSNANQENAVMTIAFAANSTFRIGYVKIGFPAGFATSSRNVFMPTKEGDIEIPILRNPTKAGLYGPFTMETHCDWSSVVLDSNQVFGFVEVAQAAKPFKSLEFFVEPLHESEYLVSVEFSVKHMWQYEEVEIQISPRWTLLKLNCTAYDPNPIKLQCNNVSSLITLRGLEWMRSSYVNVSIGTFSKSLALEGHWRVATKKLGSSFYSFFGTASEVGTTKEVNATAGQFTLGMRKMVTFSFELPSGLPAGGSIVVSSGQQFEECWGPGQIYVEKHHFTCGEMEAIQLAGRVELQCLVAMQSKSFHISIVTYSGAVEQSMVVDKLSTTLDGECQECKTANLTVKIGPSTNGYIEKLNFQLETGSDFGDMNVSLYCPFSNIFKSHSIYVKGNIAIDNSSYYPPFATMNIQLSGKSPRDIELSGQFLLLSDRKLECNVTATQGSTFLAVSHFSAPESRCNATASVYGLSQSLVKVDIDPLLDGTRYLELSTPVKPGDLIPTDEASRERVENRGSLMPGSHFTEYIINQSAGYFSVAVQDSDFNRYIPLPLSVQDREVRIRQFLLIDGQKIALSEHKCEVSMLTFEENSGNASLRVIKAEKHLDFTVPEGTKVVLVSFSQPTALENMNITPQSSYHVLSSVLLPAAVLVHSPPPSFTLSGFLFPLKHVIVTALALAADTFTSTQFPLIDEDLVKVSSVTPTMSKAREAGVLHDVTLSIMQSLPAGTRVEMKVASDWLSSGCIACATSVVAPAEAVCGVCGNTVQVVLSRPFPPSLLSVRFQGFIEPSRLAAIDFLESVSVFHNTVMQHRAVAGSTLTVVTSSPRVATMKATVSPITAPNSHATVQVTLTLSRVLPAGAELHFLSQSEWAEQGDVSALCQQSLAASCYVKGMHLSLKAIRDSWEIEEIRFEMLLNLGLQDNKLTFFASWEGHNIVQLSEVELNVMKCDKADPITFGCFPRLPGALSTYYLSLPRVPVYQPGDSVWVVLPHQYEECSDTIMLCHSPEIDNLVCTCNERTVVVQNISFNGTVSVFIEGVKHPGIEATGAIQVFRVREQSQCWFQHSVQSQLLRTPKNN